jgi:hypothetical protein
MRSLGHVIVSKWAIGAACVHIAGSHQLSTRPTQRSPGTVQCQCRCVQLRSAEGKRALVLSDRYIGGGLLCDSDFRKGLTPQPWNAAA